MTIIENKLVQARKEYNELLHQFDNADNDLIDHVIYKMKAKEIEIDALKDQVILQNNRNNIQDLQLRTFVIPA